MQTFVNIVVVAYLAFAPGMDVSQLLKSIGLCEFFETQIHTDHCDHGENHVNHFHSSHCLSNGHNHGQQPDGQDSNDSNTEDTDHHHHHENIVVETSVMAAAASVAAPAPVVVLYASQQLPKTHNVVERLRQQSPRAPPWARQSLTVKLIV